ncbi:protein NRT1/ PTR FAMILY 3.1-like isoform X2 [Andrographis paniculata]|uniref:protein NRT1/ PTR FAMILY 3.1-like isoform X2 n=1 Tax=Andrographis paniculata TaxID=175694 RepID=UPI0021E93649|nr:protein NRT1/ PTR FAMILY 3.1-like isoform X2 [Andrographis paniculata]
MVSMRKKDRHGDGDEDGVGDVVGGQKQGQGGLITMPFIFANEICEKMAVVGFGTNMISYLTGQLHLPVTAAANTLTNFGGTAAMTPLLGAFIADSFAGRFWTITFASLIYQLGMISLTISAILPSLRPPPCKDGNSCKEADTGQLAILYVSLLLTALGSGGIRPCVVSFGADQFDENDPEQKTTTWKFFNWYYFSMGASILVANTVIVYIQDNIGWGVGLGIPAAAMFMSIVVFVFGYPLYRKLEPAGSPYTRLVQVCVAAYRKRKVVAGDGDDGRMLYENEELDAPISIGGSWTRPPLLQTTTTPKLPIHGVSTPSTASKSSNPSSVWAPYGPPESSSSPPPPSRAPSPSTRPTPWTATSRAASRSPPPPCPSSPKPPCSPPSSSTTASSSPPPAASPASAAASPSSPAWPLASPYRCSPPSPPASSRSAGSATAAPPIPSPSSGWRRSTASTARRRRSCPSDIWSSSTTSRRRACAARRRRFSGWRSPPETTRALSSSASCISTAPEKMAPIGCRIKTSTPENWSTCIGSLRCYRF